MNSIATAPAVPTAPIARLAARARAVWTETGLVWLGIVAIAVHVLDDGFLQPQPGTSAGDHLGSGLMSLGVLCGAAWAYPRLRGGRRGAMALLLGVAGIVAGGEALISSAKAGPSGDDYTGLLAVPAGFLLVGVGAVTLWRTRRVTGRRPLRYLRRGLLSALGALVGFFVVFPLGFAYLSAHVGRSGVPVAHLGVPYERVTFTTSDGLDLSGWYVPSRNRAAVIVFPGRSGPQAHARMLARHGYGVLLFDRRGQGESEGDPHAFGWEGEKDIKAAIAFLQRRPDVDRDRIGGLGLSVGGELMLQTAAETSALKAVVSEGAGSRSVGEFRRMPHAPLAQHVFETVLTAGLALFSDSPPPPLLHEVIGRIAPRPLFLIWATHGVDTEALNPGFYRAAGEPKTLWEVPEARHTQAIRARPAVYERRVVRFFDEALIS